MDVKLNINQDCYLTRTRQLASCARLLALFLFFLIFFPIFLLHVCPISRKKVSFFYFSFLFWKLSCVFLFPFFLTETNF